MHHGSLDRLTQIVKHHIKFFIRDDQRRRNNEHITVVAENHSVFIAPIADKDTVFILEFGTFFAVIHEFDRPQSTHTLNIAHHVKFIKFGQLGTDFLIQFGSAFHQMFTFKNFQIGKRGGAADTMTAKSAATAEFLAGFAEGRRDLLGILLFL